MKTVEQTGFKFGLMITIGLIAYFLIMKAVGLVHNVELRAFNAIIMFSGIYLAIRNYKKNHPGNFEFLKGFGVGLFTSLVVSILFTAFMGFYVLTNADFLQAIKANEPQGVYINEWAVAIIIFIEAIASGMIFSFMTMQWLKEPYMSKTKKINHPHYAH